jgi:trigger factor
VETIEKPLTIKTKVIKEESCEMTFSVELPKTEVDKETDAVFQNIQSRASLPGFRTGKAPLDLVRRNFSEKARQTVLENLIGRSAAQVLRERKLQTLDTPRIENISFEPGKPLVFQMKVEKDPELKVRDYKGIKVNQKADTVTDATVSRTLEELQERNSTLVQSSAETLAKNQFAVIDFDGKIDGKAFSGGSAKDYLLDMTTPQTIAGFSEGLLGAKLNEVRDVTATFPADYPRKEWAGKTAVFHVTIKEIKEKKLPALDDEFAKDLGLTSLAELKQKVRENLEKELTARTEKEVEDQLFQTLIDKNTFSVPASMVEQRVKTLMQRARTQLERQGLMKAGDTQADAALRERVRPQADKDVRM